MDQVTGKPVVLFELPRGVAGQFAMLTQRLFETRGTGSPDHLAFKLDGELLMAAVVNLPFLGGNGQIMVDMTEDEAGVTAAIIVTEPLPVQLRFVGVESPPQRP